MEYRGIAKGNIIELEEPLPFEEGTNVEVSVKLMPKPRKGSPEAVLQLAGTLTDEEAELILKAVDEHIQYVNSLRIEDWTRDI